MDREPLVSVVILNWNGTEDTLRCIQSLRDTKYRNIELLIVDNQFSAESKARLENIDFFAPVTYIAHQENLGFTGGEISAFKECKGQYILLLNNDASLDNLAIEQAVTTMSSNKEIAALGGRSYALDDDWSKHSSHFYSHQRVDPVSAEVTTYEKDDSKPREVSNISGACVLINRDAITEVGYFDDTFFAYYEETDLFSRFRRNGWKIYYDPKVIVWHKHGASTKNKKYMFHYYMLRNQFRFAYKNFDEHSLRLYKKVYARNFRRSLKVYLKNPRNVSVHDAIHKARVISSIHNYLQLHKLWFKRRNIQKNNPSFSLNSLLYVDNPLPVSVLVDAINITKQQEKNLHINLSKLTSQGIKPGEIIVVSKRPLSIPSSDAQVRIENVVDKGIFNMSALDYFMMASNFDTLLFASKEFIARPVTTSEWEDISTSLKRTYESMVSDELAGIVTRNDSEKKFGRNDFLKGGFSVVGLRKTFLVHYLVDNTNVASIDERVITNVLGESIAQCRKIETVDLIGKHFGIPAGNPDTGGYAIINHPMKWNVKNLLIKLHLLIFIKLAEAVFRKLLRSQTQTDPKESLSKNMAILRYSKDIPVIINARDRFDPLMKLVSWLDSLGHNRILFVDNDSSYPPLIKFFESCPYQVVRLGRNGMHKAPWESFGVRFAAKEMPYIVSDPDIIPSAHYPQNPVSYFNELLNRYPDANKVGFGLKIDDLPEKFSHKEQVVSWETQFWAKDKLLEPDVYKADLDTTFALYRPHTWWFLGPSIRTGGKYVATHEPWYQDLDNPTEDFVYYTARANNSVSTWSFKKLPKHHLRALKKEGFIAEFEDDEEEQHVTKIK